MRISSRCHWTIHLDAAEYFTATTKTGRITVRMISGDIYKDFGTHSRVLARGFAINKDGKQGAIQRQDYFAVEELPGDLPKRVYEMVREESKRYAME